ncbi:MAG: hypothetical protein IKW88_00990 [Clostridiales bacterium]|nr:hypothetical protein [Clostridiales bacterium]
MASEKKKPGALIAIEDYRAIRPNLSQQQKGDLLDLLMDLAETVSDQQLSSDDLIEYLLPEPDSDDPMIRIAFGLMGSKVVSNIRSFKQRSETNSANAAAGKGSSAIESDRQRSQAIVGDRGERKGKERKEKGKEAEAEAEEKEIGLPETVIAAAAAANFKINSSFRAMIALYVNKYGEETVIKAIQRADENSSPGDDKRSISYIRATCEGIESDKKESALIDWD